MLDELNHNKSIGYVCYVPDRNRFVTTNNVAFDEHHVFNWRQLDYSDDDFNYDYVFSAHSEKHLRLGKEEFNSSNNNEVLCIRESIF